MDDVSRHCGRQQLSRSVDTSKPFSHQLGDVAQHEHKYVVQCLMQEEQVQYLEDSEVDFSSDDDDKEDDMEDFAGPSDTATDGLPSSLGKRRSGMQPSAVKRQPHHLPLLCKAAS